MVEAGLRALSDRKMPGLTNRKLYEVGLRLTLARQVEYTGIEIDRPLQIAACDRDVIDARRLETCLRGGRTPARRAERGKRANEFASRQRTLLAVTEQAIDCRSRQIRPLDAFSNYCMHSDFARFLRERLNNSGAKILKRGETMDAIELIKQDHRRIAELFEQFLQAESDMTQEELLQGIQTGLSAHSEMEERVLYSEVKSIAADQVQKALEEHSEVKEILAELLDADLDEDSFEKRFRELMEDVQTHVEEEEASGGILELAREHFSDSQLSLMGSHMQDIQGGEREEDLAA